MNDLEEALTVDGENTDGVLPHNEGTTRLAVSVALFEHIKSDIADFERNQTMSGRKFWLEQIQQSVDAYVECFGADDARDMTDDVRQWMRERNENEAKS